MASRFSAQMSGQMPGWPAAMRVMSRKPPAARRSTARCSSERSAARRIMVAAVRCGTCDTVATSESWRSGGMATTDAPSDGHDRCGWWRRRRRRCRRPASAPRSPLRTGRAATRRRLRARSRPWDGPRRSAGRPSGRASGVLTLPTSVTSPWPAARAARTSSATAPTGVATKVTLGVGVVADARRGRPARGPRAAMASDRSRPVTCQPWARRARPIDPPISPVPTIWARRIGHGPRPVSSGRSSRRSAAPSR